MSASVIAERLQLFSSRVDDAAVHHRSTQTIHAAAGHADAVPGRPHHALYDRAARALRPKAVYATTTGTEK